MLFSPTDPLVVCHHKPPKDPSQHIDFRGGGGGGSMAISSCLLYGGKEHNSVLLSKIKDQIDY